MAGLGGVLRNLSGEGDSVAGQNHIVNTGVNRGHRYEGKHQVADSLLDLVRLYSAIRFGCLGVNIAGRLKNLACIKASLLPV